MGKAPRKIGSKSDDAHDAPDGASSLPSGRNATDNQSKPDLASQWKQTADRLMDLTVQRKDSLTVQDTLFLVSLLRKMPLGWLRYLLVALWTVLIGAAGYLLHQRTSGGQGVTQPASSPRIAPEQWEFDVAAAKFDSGSWLNRPWLSVFLEEQRRKCDDLRAHGDCMVIGIRTVAFRHPTPQLKIQISAINGYQLAGVVFLVRKQQSGESLQQVSEGSGDIIAEIAEADSGDCVVMIGRVWQSGDMPLPAPEDLHKIFRVEALQ